MSLTLQASLPASPEVLATRRAALMARLAGGAVLLHSGRAPVRSHTTHYAFRPDSDFFYLTGFGEPDSALLLLAGRAIAFVRPRDPLAETWHGRRVGVEAAVAALGVDEAYPTSELAARLPALLEGHDSLCYPLGAEPWLDALVLPLVHAPGARTTQGPTTVVHPRAVLHELRLLKGPEELVAMRRAAAATMAGFEAAITRLWPGSHERELRAALEGGFGACGAEAPAYNTIVASGANATILHYTDCLSTLAAGELVLLDAGAEVGGYCSDVTRVLPVSGRFSPTQRAAYEVVLAAQAAALAGLKAGEPWNAYHERADRELTAGLVRLGVLEGEVEALLRANAHKPYTLHRAGHFLGLDTHDVGRQAIAGAPRPLEAGMVLTVEPGLYFPTDDWQVPEPLRGLGIRIEDDVVVQAEGYELLTAAIPKQVEAIEAWLAARAPRAW